MFTNLTFFVSAFLLSLVSAIIIYISIREKNTQFPSTSSDKNIELEFGHLDLDLDIPQVRRILPSPVNFKKLNKAEDNKVNHRVLPVYNHITINPLIRKIINQQNELQQMKRDQLMNSMQLVDDFIKAIPFWMKNIAGNIDNGMSRLTADYS